jgi:hypothetical protein
LVKFDRAKLFYVIPHGAEITKFRKSTRKYRITPGTRFAEIRSDSDSTRSDSMTAWQEEMIDSIDHRGCGIRAASYPIGPQSWLPEACVSLDTEMGTRKLWIRSFAHCFGAEQLTFPNKLDADSWALGAARKIIDRAFER